MGMSQWRRSLFYNPINALSPVLAAPQALRNVQPRQLVNCHLAEKSAFRPCGRDLVEFFKSTRWASYVKLA